MGMNFLIDRGEGALQTSESLSGERFRLSLERIGMMAEEECTAACCVPFFRSAAEWILMLLDHRRMLEDGSFETMPLRDLEEKNRALYEDILPEHYEESWANPGYAIRETGEEMGPLLSALMTELRSMISLVYEGDAERFLIRMELLLEVYFAFVTAWNDERADEEAQGEQPEPQGQDSCIGRDKGDLLTGKAGQGMPPAGHIRDKIRQFLEDYAEEETLVRVRRSLVGGSVPEKIINEWYVPGDPRCMYRYGAYIGAFFLILRAWMKRQSPGWRTPGQRGSGSALK